MIDTQNIKGTLDLLLQKSDAVFITPHMRPDFDALGAAIGMTLICKKFKKKCYVIIDDDYKKLDNEINKIIDNVKKNIEIIKACNIDKFITDNSLLIAVDVNKEYLISPELKNTIDKFQDIMIIDHHKPDENTIKTPYLFTYDKLSSTCEEISRMIFCYNVKLPIEYANYLLAGIILDTNKLTKNVSTDTFSIITKLTAKGADPAVANDMFLEDYENDRKMLKIIHNASFISYTYTIACGDNTTIFNTEDIAKAADYLLKYKNNASFALGYIDEETISISARSKGLVDVSYFMKQLGGGGNEYSAAAKIKGMTLEEVIIKLNNMLNPTLKEEKVKMLSLK